ncbi:MAG: DEAD/DEAH box helicase family protein [Victivallales bacterium]
MNNRFAEYTVDYIRNVMSLRTPQWDSLKILEKIMQAVMPSKALNLKQAAKTVNELYPICTDFEREFMSLTFALATGVGKTRLMGAFIAFLYTRYNIRNFFVVAPGTTVYEKLKTDLGAPGTSKYVFNGLGCFNSPPVVISDDDYRQKQLPQFDSDVRIFIFNIDKFNKEDAKMRATNEVLGDSFYKTLAALPDLVLIMDESHHYRAERGAKALNDLHPVLGLELTATPLYGKGNKQVPFKNVVFEYPLSKAISDGYTRTPFAVTRSDINFYNFGDEQLDKMMLLDGITCHENIKTKLAVYAANNNKRAVKPFMLVVCKDTDHAKWVLEFIRSNEFCEGRYANKTIIVHSKQSRVESEENTRLLLDVERNDNVVEIVIHVDKLKEGWDVNNLYTIVPLRTAASKILREQMVGRGLRLPYGERVGDKDIDAVMLTAHDKFNDIMEEAQKGDSIFKAGNVINVEDIVPESTVTTNESALPGLDSDINAALQETGITQSARTEELVRKTQGLIASNVVSALHNSPEHKISAAGKKKIVKEVAATLTEDKDLGDIYKENADPFYDWITHTVETTHRSIVNKYITIPRIKITDPGEDEYAFVDFDLDLTDFTQVPIQNELLIQNLEDFSDKQRIRGAAIDFEGYMPERVIVSLLREKPEIDYVKCRDLLFKLITQVCNHYKRLHGENGLKNIVMMYKRNIANEIYKQMMQHFYIGNTLFREEVIDATDFNMPQNYSYRSRQNFFASYNSTDDGAIKSVVFDGIKKGVFTEAKFDSVPELTFARVIESDADVKNWLRPAKKQFNITYNRNQPYEPDFVVETNTTIYLVEVKGEDKLNLPDTVAKRERGIRYCQVASDWGKANGYKGWRYLFIPSKQIQPNSTFANLQQRFAEKTQNKTTKCLS